MQRMKQSKFCSLKIENATQKLKLVEIAVYLLKTLVFMFFMAIISLKIVIVILSINCIFQANYRLELSNRYIQFLLL